MAKITQIQIQAFNKCLLDLYNYYQTCGNINDLKNHQILREFLENQYINQIEVKL